jgi:hypothetical protein
MEKLTAKTPGTPREGSSKSILICILGTLGVLAVDLICGFTV